MNYFSNFKHTRDGIMFLYLCMLDNGDGVRTSVRALSEELSISQPCVRGSLKRLISTSFVSKVRLNCGQGKGLLIKPMNTAVSGLFENLDRLSKPVSLKFPASMERLGQNYGYILYRSTLERERNFNYYCRMALRG